MVSCCFVLEDEMFKYVVTHDAVLKMALRRRSRINKSQFASPTLPFCRKVTGPDCGAKREAGEGPTASIDQVRLVSFFHHPATSANDQSDPRNITWAASEGQCRNPQVFSERIQGQL